MRSPLLQSCGLVCLLATSASADSFQSLGAYYAVGSLQDHIVGPGPAPGSQRLYLDYTYVGQALDLVAVDPDTGNFQVFPGPVPSEYSPNQMVIGPDGNLYVGTAPNAHGFRLQISTGKFTDLGRPSTTEQYIWGLTTAADGKIYGCTYPSAKLVRIDPTTGALADLGRMDPTELYGRYVAASPDGFVYVGIGYATQHLAAYQISTGTHQDILPAQYQLTGVVNVYLGADSNVYATSGTQHFRLSGFTATPIAASAAKSAAPWNVLQDGRTLTIGSGTTAGTLSVRTPSTGKTVTLPYNYAGEPLALFRVSFGPDGMLYSSSVLPLNLVFADPALGQISNLGNLGGGEAYSLMPYNGRLLIATYSGDSPLMSYDPLAPFAPAATKGNPLLIDYTGANEGWRPESMIAGPQGIVYIGAVAGYGLLMGPLTVWDTAANQVSSYSLYPDQSVVSVTAAGNYIVGGTSIDGGGGSHPTATQAYLFLWDPATQQKVFDTVPVPNAASIDNLVTAPDGTVFGITGTKLFVFDPQARAVTYTASLPFSGVLSSTLSLGPDGNLWGLTSSGIFNIVPSTRKATLVAKSPQPPTAGFAMDTAFIYYASNAVLNRYQWAPFAVVSAPSGYTLLAPGSFGSIYGTGLANSTVAIRDANGQNYPCKILGATADQINFVVPSSAAPGPASISMGTLTTPIRIGPVSPGIFTANGNGSGPPLGQIARVTASGSISYEPVAEPDPASGQLVPAPVIVGNHGEQVYLVLFTAGVRNRSSLAGVIARTSRGDFPAAYAGSQGQYTGLDQVNILLPASLAGSGAVQLRLSVDGIASNPVALLFP